MATTHSLGATQGAASSDCRAEETASDSDRAVSGLRFFSWSRHARKSSCNCSDAKWIARWFKRIDNPTKKSKAQSKVGRVDAFSGSQTAVATTAAARSIDDEFDSVNSAANLAKPASSGESPNQLSSGDALGHAALFSPRSRIISASLGSPTTRPHDAGARRPESWESDHMSIAPPDLQGNRQCPIFYVHSPQASNRGFPSSDLDLAGHSQRSPLIAAIPTYDLSPFRHGDAPSSIGASMETPSVGSHDPHTLPGAGISLLQPSYAHLDLVSESSALAPAYTDLVHTLHNLGPAAAAATAAARTRASIGLPVVPELDSDTAQLGPSSVPLPSIYWLLFDMDCDSIDQLRDGNVSSLSPPRLPSGNAGGTGTALPQHGSVVAPTPVSFMAKWEDMLALERRVRSSSRSLSRNHNGAADMPQLKHVPEAQTQSQSQARAPTPVEANRAKRDDWEFPHHGSLTGTR